MADYKTLDDIDVGGAKVLLRVDLNMPVDAEGLVTDDTRLRRILPTLTELIAQGARVAILTHYGRPKGVRADAFSTAFLGRYLSEALGGMDVGVASDCIGAGVARTIDALKPGEVLLLENLRFHKGEEANDPKFAKALAALGEIYINDAFSASHRAHASIVGVPALLPHAAGRAMEAELEALDKALGNPARPVMAIIGGAKVSTKIALLENLIAKVDLLAIGGGMANTFLHAQGHDVGRSLCEPDLADTARAILAKAAGAGCEILLPVDAVVLDDSKADGAPMIVRVDAVPPEAMILDIGPDSADLIGNRIPDCKTVVWNGPVGLFETPPFDTATVMLARTTARMTRAGALVSVAGGGDTVAALVHAGAEGGFTYISTAGGAFLEWMEGKPLPGVEALKA